MTFGAFIVICVVGLLAVYVYIIFAPQKQGTQYEEVSNYPIVEVVIEPPIKVSSEMVTYHPEEANFNNKESQKEEARSLCLPPSNRYDKEAIVSMATSEDEMVITATLEEVQQGKKLFSTINI